MKWHDWLTMVITLCILEVGRQVGLWTVDGAFLTAMVFWNAQIPQYIHCMED